MAEERRRGFATRSIHGTTTPPVEQETPSVPIYQTSTFRFDTADDYAETIAFRRPGYTYTRGYGNPTILAFEQAMADLEGTESAFGFASGMAAIHTVVTSAARGGRPHRREHRALRRDVRAVQATSCRATGSRSRSSTRTTSTRWRGCPAGRARCSTARRSRTRTSRSSDLEALGRRCAAMPACPLPSTTRSPHRTCAIRRRYGFDHVLHSATKYVGGHNDLIGGVVCCGEEELHACAPP